MTAQLHWQIFYTPGWGWYPELMHQLAFNKFLLSGRMKEVHTVLQLLVAPRNLFKKKIIIVTTFGFCAPATWQALICFASVQMSLILYFRIQGTFLVYSSVPVMTITFSTSAAVCILHAFWSSLSLVQFILHIPITYKIGIF